MLSCVWGKIALARSFVPLHPLTARVPRQGAVRHVERERPVSVPTRARLRLAGLDYRAARHLRHRLPGAGPQQGGVPIH